MLHLNIFYQIIILIILGYIAIELLAIWDKLASNKIQLEYISTKIDKLELDFSEGLIINIE